GQARRVEKGNFDCAPRAVRIEDRAKACRWQRPGEAVKTIKVAAVGQGIEEGDPESLLRPFFLLEAGELKTALTKAPEAFLERDLIDPLVAETFAGVLAGLAPEGAAGQPGLDAGPAELCPGGEGGGRRRPAA